jgi:intracellular multiplication protein IcmV
MRILPMKRDAEYNPFRNLYFALSSANVEKHISLARATLSMPLKDVFKVSRKTFLNPSGWLGVNELKNNTAAMWSIIKGIVTPEKTDRVETFEEAMQRLHLTEQDVENNKNTYYLYALGFLVLGIAAFLSSFYYLFYHQTISGCLLGLAVTAFLFAQAFRYHFWYFQIKHRKLGCTFAEWRQGKPFEKEEPKL